MNNFPFESNRKTMLPDLAHGGTFTERKTLLNTWSGAKLTERPVGKQSDKKKSLLFIYFSLFIIITAQAQVIVTATAGFGGPSNYPTLHDAFNAVNLGTHRGAINIYLTASINEGTTPATLNGSGAGAAQYSTVLIQALSDSVVISGNPGSGYGVIQLNGASNVTIEGQDTGNNSSIRNLSIINTSADTSRFSSCIRLATSPAAGSCNNISISDCKIIGNAIGKNSAAYTSATGVESTSFGIYAGGNGGLTSISAPQPINSIGGNAAQSGTTINGLSVDHNLITACAIALSLNGADATVADIVSVNKNIIGSTAALTGSVPYSSPSTTTYNTGIYINGVNQVSITGNNIKNIMSYTNVALYGINLGPAIGNGGVLIAGNTISAINNGSGTLVNAVNVSNTNSNVNLMSNVIGPVEAFAGATVAGIQTGGGATGSKIQMNLVSGIHSFGSGGGAYGINVTGGNQDTIINNFISDANANLSSGSLSTTTGIHGLRIAGGTNHKIFFNSVNLSGTLAGASGAGMASAITITSNTITGMEVGNNIFANTLAGAHAGSAISCIALPAGMSSSYNYTENNNAYYGSQLGQSGTSSVSGYTIAAFNASSTSGTNNWRNYTSTLATGNNSDNASFSHSVAAPFVSATDLHIDTTLLEAAYLYKTAYHVPGIIYDVDGQSRIDSIPIIGADAFNYSKCTGNPVAGIINASPDSVCNGGNSVLNLSGQSAATGISVLWKWSNTTGGPYTNAGDTTTEENISSLTANRYYICQLTCNAGGTTSTTPEKQITVTNVTASAANGGPYIASQTLYLSSLPNGEATYNWSGPAGFTNNTQNPSVANTTVAEGGIYTVTVTNTIGCSATASTTVVITNPGATTWTGSIDTNWNVAGNWSPAVVPNSCSNNVIIPLTTNQPVISTAVSIGNLQLSSGTRLTLGSTLNICGNITGGSSTATITGSGTINLQGTAPQSISGTTAVNIITINNNAGVAVQAGAKLDIYTSLNLQSGNFDATNGTVTFKSTSSNQVAIIDNFSAGYTGTFTGNIHAERYYDASTTYNQHFMSSPVNSPAFSQFGASGTAGFVIPKADCDETHLASNSPYGTVFSYNEANGAVCSYAQWKVEVAGSTQNGMGYSILNIGAGTLTLTGQPNLNASYTLTGLTNSNWSNTTLQGHTINSGWHLLANPYLATLNIQTTNSDFDNQVQVWNAEGPYAGTYQPFMVGDNAIVAPFQAYMVHKTVAGGTSNYTISASDRVRTPQTFYNLQSEQLTINATNAQTGMADKTLVGFNARATAAFDPSLDADKFAGALNRHTIYSLAGTQWMSRNLFHSISESSNIPIGFEPGVAGAYSLSFSGINTFDPTSYIYLEDKKLNITQNARNGAYNFTADTTDDWNRFVIHFTPAAQISTSDATCNSAGNVLVRQDGAAVWNFMLIDTNNTTIASGILSNGNIINQSVPAGTYTLILVDSANYTVIKSITVNGALPITASIDVANDTVQQNQNLVVQGTANGATAYDWNFGNGNSATGATVNTSYTNAGSYVISLTAANQYQCSATATKTITVVQNTATSVLTTNTDKAVSIWSSENRIYVDFGTTADNNATVVVYNVLGQELSREKPTASALYQKQINDVDAAYFIVDVINSGNTQTTKKVFITNSK